MTITELLGLLGLLVTIVASWTSLNVRLAALKKDVALLRSNDVAHVYDEVVKIREKLDERPCGEHEVKLDEMGRRLAELERKRPDH